jgi:hypothetical protein
MAPLLKFATSSGYNKKELRYACQKFLKVPGKGGPLHVHITGTLWREMLRLQSQWFVIIIIIIIIIIYLSFSWATC